MARLQYDRADHNRHNIGFENDQDLRQRFDQPQQLSEESTSLPTSGVVGDDLGQLAYVLRDYVTLEHRDMPDDLLAGKVNNPRLSD